MVTGFPLVHIISGTNVGEKLRKLTTIHRNVVWVCQHILHNFQTCSGVARVNLMSLSKRGANSVVPACIDISTNIVDEKFKTKHTLQMVRIVTGFPLVHIIPRTNLGEKLRKFTTIHRNMIWAC